MLKFNTFKVETYAKDFILIIQINILDKFSGYVF